MNKFLVETGFTLSLIYPVQKSKYPNSTFILFASVILVLFATGQVHSQSESLRGVWVVRHELNTKAGIDQMLEFSRRNNITDLFVQVRGRGDAYYNSTLEPKGENISPPDFDPLMYLLQRSQRDSIRIHAWVNVFYVWSKDSLPGNQNHIVNTNGEWLARPVDKSDLLFQYPARVRPANMEGLYVSPLQPEAQEHFLQVIREILEHYPVDGIHLDYIRYPGPNFDMHPSVVRGFRHRYAIDPSKFLNDADAFASKFSLAGYESFYYHWRRYLMDGLSEFVGRIAETVHAYKGNILLSAAVKPDLPRARWDYFQDWKKWLEEGWLDFAVPMNYAVNQEIFRQRLQQYANNLPNDKYMVGIALYNQPEDLAVRKMAQAAALKNLGIVLFSYQQLIHQPQVSDYLRRRLKLDLSSPR